MSRRSMVLLCCYAHALSDINDKSDGLGENCGNLAQIVCSTITNSIATFFRYHIGLVSLGSNESKIIWPLFFKMLALEAKLSPPSSKSKHP